MSISLSGTAIVACAFICQASPALAQVNQQRAEDYFKEARVLCERDGAGSGGCRYAGRWRLRTL